MCRCPPRGNQQAAGQREARTSPRWRPGAGLRPPPLDATDRHLLSLLQANAREPAALLARKLGVARTTVVARIARLERDGVIAGYGVRV